MIKSILTEYGLSWVFNRALYAIKLKMLRVFPFTEFLFERKVKIIRLDIFTPNIKNLEVFLNKFSSEEKFNIISIADKAIVGKIKGFSSIDMDYGQPINWHLNPITGKTIDNNKKWFNIPDFDPVIGDIKGVWEISRFTHLYYLVRAYIITKNIKYYRSFSSQINEWVKKNEYSFGPNFKCGQEATLRMINVLITYESFKHYGLTSETDKENVKKIVQTSYKKVRSNFFYAHKCIRNNHTLSEITGLIIGAWCSNKNQELKKAYRLLNKEIDYQFFDDGGYIQYSFNYQRFAFQIIEFALSISDKTGYQIISQNKDKLKKSVLQLYQLQDESGLLPNYGSNDGALVFPVNNLDYLNYKPILNSLYALLTNNLLYECGKHDEELIWFKGTNVDSLPIKSIKRLTNKFPDAGLYLMRNNNSHMMIVLQNFRSRPAQMDQLHVDLWYKGINILCDSGTFSYASDFGKSLSLTSAHNTVKINSVEQMKKFSHFMLYDWPRALDIKFNENRFEGKMKSKSGYSHKRIIDYINGEYIITDSVESKENYTINFHTICDIKQHDHTLDLFYHNKRVAQILTSDVVEIKKCSISRYYLKEEKISCLSIKKSSNETSVIRIVIET